MPAFKNHRYTDYCNPHPLALPSSSQKEEGRVTGPRERHGTCSD